MPGKRIRNDIHQADVGRRLLVLAAALVGLIGLAAHIGLAWSSDTRNTPPAQPLDEVVVSARSMAGWAPPVGGLDAAPSAGADNAVSAAEPLQNDPGVRADAPNGHGGGPSGLAGSRLGASLRSEFLHVFVIVDSNKVRGLPLAAVSDYVAMISLTRLSAFDSCSELPSIVDLLASTCGDRPPPDSITVADTAFLKALYHSDLEMKLNIEQGEMHDRMLTLLEQH